MFLAQKKRMKKPKRKKGSKSANVARGKGRLLSGRVPGKLQAFIELVRPFTLLAPIIGGFSAALISFRVNKGVIPWPQQYEAFPFFRWDFVDPLMSIIWGVIALVTVNAASNALNQVHDIDIDKINKPYRPLPSKRILKDEARSVAWFLYLITLWRAPFLNRSFAFFVLILMLMTIAYSAEPLRFKKRLWLNNFSIAISRGLFGFVAAWCIFDDNPFDTMIPWAIGLVMAFFLFGSITAKDFTDAKGDRKYNIRTLPVVYGRRFAAGFTAMFFIVPFVVIPLEALFDWLIPETFYLIALVGWGFYVLILMKEAAYAKHDEVFENSPVWKHMYLMLLALQFGFCTIYLLFY
jgi:4-hydroxybenzoate polyprenyltransferase